MREREAVLFANDTFYEAFRAGDVAAMEAIWARQAQVVCIHPGWRALHGHEEVMQSWRAILGAGKPPQVRCRAARVLPLGEEAAAVVCYEQLEGGLLATTNLFIREDGTWRLVHHQAGPTQLDAESLAEEPEPPAVQ